MLRVSQKLLILLLSIFLATNATSVWAYKFHYKFSLSKGTDGVPLHQPFAVFFYEEGKRLYVCDAGNNRLISYDLKGQPLKEFDASGKLKGPISMLKDDHGNLWIIERPTNSLTFVDLKAHHLENHQIFYKGRPLLLDRLLFWRGFLLVLDRASGKVFMVTKRLKVKKVIYPTKIKAFRGFFDIKIKGNWLWGLENMGHRVVGINLVSGQQRAVVIKKRLVEPVSFEIDQRGNFYLLDRDLKKIFVFDGEGRLRYSFLKEGFRPGEVRYPWGILFVGSYLLVIDEGNGRIDFWGH